MLRHLMQLTHKLDIPKRTLYSPVLNGLQSEWFEFPWCFDNWGDIINGNCVNLTPIICTCYATVSYLIFFSTNLNYAFNILWFLSRHHDRSMTYYSVLDSSNDQIMCESGYLESNTICGNGSAYSTLQIPTSDLEQRKGWNCF